MRIVLLLTVGLLISSCVNQVNVMQNGIILVKSKHLFSKDLYAVNTQNSKETIEKIPKYIGDQPDWSPDGQWIVYSTNFEARFSANDIEPDIFLIKFDGSEKIKLVEKADDPDWSLDGNHIAYSSDGGIYVADVSCYITKRQGCVLTPKFIVEGYSPSWSPDGKMLVFQVLHRSIVSIVNIENLEVSALPENLGECVTPSWSHVENKIAVSCWSDTDEGVYIYDFANAAITKLELGKRCYKPQWSPDGEKIACIAQYVESIKYQDIQPPHDALYIMDKNGENLTRITFREEENIYWFSWVPDNGNLQECWGLCQ